MSAASVESASENTVISLPASAHWREDAYCKGELKLFFRPRAERPRARARREAKANRLCEQCSVFDRCRSWARQNREYGYWAGESEEDRHLIGFQVSAPIGERARLARQDEPESA